MSLLQDKKSYCMGIPPIKICSDCKKELPISSFGTAPCKKNNKSYTRGFCKKCSTNRRKSWSANRQEAIRLLKVAPCKDCGGTFPAPCMDFDHVKGAKAFDLGKAAQKGIRWELVLQEIAKCELVCANCHRLRTHTRRVG